MFTSWFQDDFRLKTNHIVIVTFAYEYHYLIHCQREALSHLSNYQTLPVCDMPLQTTGRFSRKSQRLRYSPCQTLARYLMSHMDNNVIPSLYFTHACFSSVWGQTDRRKQRKWTQNYRGGGRCRRKEKKRCESLTETHGLDVALGVGDRCTVTNAIQAPVNGYLRETGGGETDIIVSEEISRCSPVATALCRASSLWLLCACAGTASCQDSVASSHG